MPGVVLEDTLRHVPVRPVWNGQQGHVALREILQRPERRIRAIPVHHPHSRGAERFAHVWHVENAVRVLAERGNAAEVRLQDVDDGINPFHVTTTRARNRHCRSGRALDARAASFFCLLYSASSSFSLDSPAASNSMCLMALFRAR